MTDPAINRLTQLLYLESSRILMDCVFTPVNKANNTGPVVGGCHDALRRLRYHWEGTLDLISGFPSADHPLFGTVVGTAWFLKINLLGLHKIMHNERLEMSLGAKIAPGKMLSLVQGLVGTNAMLIQSLVNIHLHQLDLLMAKIQFECQAQRNRRINPIIKRAPELLDPTSIKGTKFDRLSSLTVGDKNFVRVRYVRHADEIIVGIAANRDFAEKASDRICRYLSKALLLEFQANLSHVSEAPPTFLGIRVAPYVATKFARRFERELESRRRIRRRVMLRAAQREAAWNNKLRKLALSALATGIKKTRRTLGPRDTRQALVDRCTELAHKFILDPANSEACRGLLRDAESIEKTFAEELGWISLPSEIRQAHQHLRSVIRKHLSSMK